MTVKPAVIVRSERVDDIYAIRAVTIEAFLVGSLKTRYRQLTSV